MRTRLLNIMTVVAICAVIYVGYRYFRSINAIDEYREQLAKLENDYQSLRTTYNDAVRRTAVTELRVAGGKISVVIRTAEGELKSIDTPYDPNGEIYVDYIVMGGRLWIRRVFDDKTPAKDATVINPSMANIDWDAKHVDHGKAVYRKLSEGRWTITVTGDGSLGLKKQEGDDEPILAPPPPVREFKQLEK